MRWVVPPTVITPATATASHNSATSALWRRTKRVRAGIGASRFTAGRRDFRRAIASVPASRVLGRPTPVVESPAAAYSRGSTPPRRMARDHRNGLRCGHEYRSAATRLAGAAGPGSAGRCGPPAAARGAGWPPRLRDAAIAAGADRDRASSPRTARRTRTDPGRYFTGGHHLPHTPNAAFLLVLVAGAVLAWRHLFPRHGARCSTAAVVAYSLPGYVNGVALLLPAVAMGTLAALSADPPVRRSGRSPSPRCSWPPPRRTTRSARPAAGSILIPANIAVALFAGIAIGNRRAYVDSLRDRAERDARRQVDEERLRIARELHDVVAHTMATINVQASAAAQLLARPPGAGGRVAGRHPRGEQGRAARAARHTQRAAARRRARRLRPRRRRAWPGWTRWRTGCAQAGLPVTVTVTGQPRPLPAVTDLAAFRIIQEALTNTIRHAGPATADGGGQLRRRRPADGGHRHRPGTSRRSEKHGRRQRRRARPARNARAGRRGGRHHRDRPAPAGGFRVAAWFPPEARTAAGSRHRRGQPGGAR